MKKLVLSAVLVVASLLCLTLLVVAVTPLGLISPLWRQAANFTPVGRATVVEGRGVITSAEGTDIVNWRWCPGEGMSAVCFQASGYSGFFKGVVALSPVHPRLREFSFNGIDPARLAIPGLNETASLRGELRDLAFDWKSLCFHRGLARATGEMTVSGIAGGERQITLLGDGSNGVTLGGDFLQGTLKLTENSVSGLLKADLQGLSGTGENPAEINVARQFTCR